ncbi:YALI0F16731p [Yarrowia lipolytica CLIB122]|uniref:YALI0F16731p n=1 Tax=Yarrowia lipolytica (strain CLIB 122 / E 150) TaxID=284591 RepID=Q6C1F5_YARLI|nr:YALI0F16731p [Yarrowia lipolytica CLIB122]CAG78316.1 YALI0F16731p [Yarrowia lipolytica CLIB122]|eukprot:XP_505507.1 YALI0F16731p [Yarrowia lipolytica CLIB122]
MATVRVLRNFINPVSAIGIFKQGLEGGLSKEQQPLEAPKPACLPEGYSEIMDTAVYRIAPKKKSSKGPAPLVFFIPGNPGISEYYTVFLQHLAEMYPTYEFVCPSYRGYSTFNPASFKEDLYSLQDQIDNKVKILRHVVAESKCETCTFDGYESDDTLADSFATPPSSRRSSIDSLDSMDSMGSISSGETLLGSISESETEGRPVILMGHSLGGWLVQRVAVAVANDPQIDLQLVCLMTPTLKELAKSSTGQKLKTLAKQYPVPGGVLARGLQVAQKVSPLWTRVEQQFLSDALPPHIVQATRGFVSQPSIIRQWIEMGKEELVAIGTDCNDVVDFWHNNGKFKIWGFFAHQDQFVDDETRQDIFNEWGHLNHVTFDVGAEEIIHGFCIHHNQEVAQLTKQQFDQLPLHF